MNIDRVFLDTYLLVIDLRRGLAMSDSVTLHRTCVTQIEGARSTLQAAGMSARSIDLISHAHCALLDEVVLANARDAIRAAWITESLQARFFGHHRAGEMLHEEMLEVLREPAPDIHVLTFYGRVMMFGFLGRHRGLDAEERVALVKQLNARVEPLDTAPQSLLIDCTEASGEHLQWLRSPALHLVEVGVALAVLWWTLDQSLARSVAELAQGGL